MNGTTLSIEQLSSGVEGLYSPEELGAKLAVGRPLRIKLGLDPTAPDIHLGHVVQLRKLRQFQDMGHKAVLIIGDYTARIGDPSGQDITRPILDKATITANAATYLEQAGRIIDTAGDKLEVRSNSEWLSKLSFADILRLTGKVTVQQMLHRDSFKQRMKNQAEIAVSEFIYPLMQGYDSVVVQADVELGGTDQTFNNFMGRQLQEKDGQEKQVVMVLPLLVGLDGCEKMSKSKSNYVGVTDEPNEMFGKLMSIPDTLMPDYFRLLTDLSKQRISSLLDVERTHPREAKDVLAQAIIETFYDRQEANAASREFRSRFSDHQLPSDIETKLIGDEIVGVIALLRKVGFATSNSEARRLIVQGSVTFDDQKITNPNMSVQVKGQPVLKVGKRRVCKVSVAE